MNINQVPIHIWRYEEALLLERATIRLKFGIHYGVVDYEDRDRLEAELRQMIRSRLPGPPAGVFASLQCSAIIGYLNMAQTDFLYENYINPLRFIGGLYCPWGIWMIDPDLDRCKITQFCSV